MAPPHFLLISQRRRDKGVGPAGTPIKLRCGQLASGEVMTCFIGNSFQSEWSNFTGIIPQQWYYFAWACTPNTIVYIRDMPKPMNKKTINSCFDLQEVKLFFTVVRAGFYPQ